MKKEQLQRIIQEEIARELANDNLLMTETYDLEQVKYSASIQKQVDSLVSSLQKSSNLSKVQVAAILNDIIMAMGLNRTQMTLYMNMIKQNRQKYSF
jgi:ABC-type oligopeptide transport system ATPase subunit